MLSLLPGYRGRAAFIRRFLSRGALSLLAATLVAACAGDTGVVVQVSRDEATVPADIDRLRFFVGVLDSSGEQLHRFLDDADPESDIAFEPGRDLTAEPYRLLLRPGASAGGDMHVQVAVVAYRGGDMVGYGRLEHPVRFREGKVLEWPVVLRGDPDGRVTVTDTGCLRWELDGEDLIIASDNDRDCDGDPADVDCDDLDPRVGPSKPERCDNGIDDDCDGDTDEVEDADGDGFDNCEDCDDTNPDVYPGAAEICDGIDNDCSGTCDAPFDQDGDRYTTCGTKIFDDGTCSEPHEDKVDCDDTDPDVRPGADEICDGRDNNCDGSCDADFDADGDGYTTCGSIVDACDGVSDSRVDCKPEDDEVYPGADEVCDGKDNDCDGRYYPAVVSCYETEGGLCYVGSRTCGDADGKGWTSACSPSLLTPAPKELCEAYKECESQGAADPFQCANDAVQTKSFACTLHFTSAGLCLGRSVALPSDDSAGCSWTLLGGQMQRHYQATLRTANGSSTDTQVQECAAGLVILDATSQPPRIDAFYIWQRVNGLTKQLIELEITPQAVVDCPELGLSCPGLQPLPPL